MKNKISKILSITVLYMICFLFITGITNQSVHAENREKLVDDAGLLTVSEREHIEALLTKYSEENQFDIVIVTTPSFTVDGVTKDPMDFADDYFDYNGYGYGESYDGVILAIGMEERDYWISTCGFGITAMTDAGIEYIKEQIQPDLTDGDYEEAFETFANMCDDYVKQAKNGTPYDVGNMPKSDLGFTHILIALGIGAAVAAISCLTMKAQLNTIRPKNNAGDYVVEDSLNITNSSDRFLYFITKKTPKSSNSGGGSSTHHSSSGRSHGGGGGHF
jgi:uncharacterized protein